MIYYILAITSGFLDTFNKMLNVKAGECLGPTVGALINYIGATIVSLALVFATGNGGEFALSNMSKVPLFCYVGSLCGLISMLLNIVGTKKLGAMASFVLMLVGQLFASLALDYIFFRRFDLLQVFGIFLILVGMCWKEMLKQGKQPLKK